jgi:hypothetical protein
LKLEQLQDEQIRQMLSSKDEENVEISAQDRQAALELLKDPELLGHVLADLEYCGLVGEETNKLVAYLAAVSRNLDEPLAVLIKSDSAAGKTTLMDAVLVFVPPEDKVKYSAMTGQSLFYMGDMNLKHKVLATLLPRSTFEFAYPCVRADCTWTNWRRVRIMRTCGRRYRFAYFAKSCFPTLPNRTTSFGWSIQGEGWTFRTPSKYTQWS